MAAFTASNDIAIILLILHRLNQVITAFYLSIKYACALTRLCILIIKIYFEWPLVKAILAPNNIS